MREQIIINTTVHPKTCIGCKTHSKEVMLSFLSMDFDYVQDLFLSTEQAEELYEQLGKALKQNK